MKKRINIILLYLLSFIACVSPVLIYFFTNTDKYTKTVPETIKLCGGGVLMLIFAFLKVIGKLKVPSRCILFATVFILAYLLQAILNDLLIFSFLALVGEILDMIIHIPIKRLKFSVKADKIADTTAEKIDEVMQKYFRGNT